MIDLAERLANIELVIFDVDGVLTDGRIQFLDNGQQFMVFHVHDGVGIKQLRQADIHVAIITARRVEIVTRRAEFLGIEHVYLGYEEKLPAYLDLIEKLKLDRKQTAYVGDDLPDLPVLEQVGVSFAVQNAMQIVKDTVDYVTQLTGGRGAVREVCDLILNAKKTAAK